MSRASGSTDPLHLLGIPTHVAREVEPGLPRRGGQEEGALELARGRNRLEHHAGAAGPDRVGYSVADAVELRPDLVTGEDRRGNVGEQLGLALAGRGLACPALGLSRAPPPRCGEPPDDHGDDQEYREGGRVLRVSDGQFVMRRDEEVVEGQRAQDRGDESGQLPPPYGDVEYGQEIDRGEIDRRCARLQQRDHGRGQRHGEHDL